MLSSIHPFGERSRNNRWAATAVAYFIGSCAGGLVTGATFGLIGQLIPGVPGAAAALVMIAVASVVGVVADIGLGAARVPTLLRQVNEDWLDTYRGWVYGAGYGFQLGLGLATIVGASATWVAWVAAAATGQWQLGALIGSVFGATRGAAIFSGRRVDSPAKLRAFHRSLADGGASVGRVATIAVGLAGVTAVAALAAPA